MQWGSNPASKQSKHIKLIISKSFTKIQIVLSICQVAFICECFDKEVFIGGSYLVLNLYQPIGCCINAYRLVTILSG